MSVLQQRSLNKFFAVWHKSHVLEFKEALVFTMTPHVKNILNANTVLAFFVVSWLICDDHARLQNTRVRSSPSKGVVRVLMHWATVAHSMANTMGEIAAHLPQMLPCETV